MKTILLPFQDDDVSERSLESAFATAGRFGSHIEGLFVLRPPQVLAGEGIALPGGYLTELAEDGRQRAHDARERFTRFMTGKGIELGDLSAPVEGVSASWYEVEGIEGEIIGDYGRLFDLIVVGRDVEHTSPDWNAMCEAALFESGRPVLVTSSRVASLPGEKVLIAWNGSMETARTIAFGMPFLNRAESVVVLSVEGWLVQGPSGQQVASHLIRNGISAIAKAVASDGRAVGQTILDEARAIDADLLLKGAYTHSRLRQIIFGGATRQILAEAELPVLMAH